MLNDIRNYYLLRKAESPVELRNAALISSMKYHGLKIALVVPVLPLVLTMTTLSVLSLICEYIGEKVGDFYAMIGLHAIYQRLEKEKDTSYRFAKAWYDENVTQKKWNKV